MIRVFLLLLIMVSVFASTGMAQDEETIDLTPPTLGDFDPADVQDINLEDYPILPEVTDHARKIYKSGSEAGRNPQIFSKVGDCMTASAYFMSPFGLDEYDLGEYSDLQPVVDHFAGVAAREGDWDSDSFATPGLASASGFNTASVLDPIWADPEWCSADESPLSCEYRVANPAFAILMFGTNDVFFIDEASFDYYLRTIVLETINAGIVPVLNTFPPRPDFPEETILYNQIIVKIAEDYDLPLINLWLAVQPLENQGIDPVEPIHLSIPADGRTGVFDETNLQAGYTLRNLITLQALEILLDELD